MSAHPSARSTAFAAAAAFLVAALVLLSDARWFDPSRLHVHGAYGDQAGYVTTARLLADEGHLESGLVYPAFAPEPRWRPYMPGHYGVLALAYRLLGAGSLATLLPSLAAFGLTAACLVVIGARLSGLLAGALAAALYVCVPAGVAYAFTGMAESTFQAAAALAVALFLCLPDRHRPWAGALCLALPFLFRETGALLAAPLALLAARPAGGIPAGGTPAGGTREVGWRWRRAAVLVGGAALLCGALLAWQSATGRGSFPLSSWVIDGRFNYRDATATPPSPTAGEWAAALVSNVGRNAAETARQLRLAPLDPAVASYVLTLVLGLVALVLGLRRREPFALGTAALLAGVLLLLYATYDVKAHKAWRSTMFVQPLLLVVLARALAEGLRGATGQAASALRVGTAALLVAAVLGGQALARRAGEDMRRGDEPAATAVHVLSALHTDPTTLLLAPHEMIKQYAVEAYPTRVGFHPANDATLALLAERFTIGTLVLPDPDAGTHLSPEALRAAGLRRSPQRIGGERTGYVVWSRSP